MGCSAGYVASVEAVNDGFQLVDPILFAHVQVAKIGNAFQQDDIEGFLTVFVPSMLQMFGVMLSSRLQGAEMLAQTILHVARASHIIAVGDGVSYAIDAATFNGGLGSGKRHRRQAF